MRSLLTPKHVREVLLVTGGLGLGLGLSEGLGYGLSEALIFGLLYWILLGLLQGVSSEQIEDHARLLPNQGIRRSLHNSVLLALISIGIIGVIGELSVVLGSGLSYALNFTFFGPSEMLRWGLEGLRWGLEALLSYGPRLEVLILAVCGGLLVGVSYGGLAALRHSILCLLLQRAGVVPRHYVRFLDEAASCILLRKVGGGYSFVHRLLLDYFAELEIKPGSKASAESRQTSMPASVSPSNVPSEPTASAVLPDLSALWTRTAHSQYLLL